MQFGLLFTLLHSVSRGFLLLRRSSVASATVSGVVIPLDVHGGAAFLGEDWVYLVGSVRIRFK